jgi:quercetin dioxygenase-like cupin family protein
MIAASHEDGEEIVIIGRLVIVAMLSAIGLSAATAEPTGPTVTPAFRHEIPNVPGKSLVAAVVNYAPGAKSPPHRHAASAFVTAYVLSGAIRSQVDDEPVRIYRAGESWSERPGARHKVSENASATEPAQLLAVFVVDTADRNLTVPDQ